MCKQQCSGRQTDIGGSRRCDGPVVVHWFRKGLRLHDNPALLAAAAYAERTGAHLRPIFILDPHFVRSGRVGVNRWRFLAGALADLAASLSARGSRLLVCRGSPEEVLQRLIPQWDVRCLTFEADTEPYARERDARVTELARRLNCSVTSVTSHTLYEPAAVCKANGGRPPLTYQKLVSLVSAMGAPPEPEPAPQTLPPPGHCEGELDTPELAELGIDAASLHAELYPGGETEGLARLERHLARTGWCCKFEKPKTAPNSIEPSTTVLSPYLKFGCVSARLFYHRLQAVYRAGGKHSQPPVSLHGQLLWREFFYTVAANTENFDQMEGNAVCRQIPWLENEAHLKAWAEGRTGYPFIDAIMTQLRREGWIHHLARHAVACFLTRGDLFISWEHGMKVFEELLLDADWSLNAGNWMWLSASAFFHQFFRVYSPVAFGKKTDPNGDYIRKYLPQLKKFPAQYIYEPWKAPLSMQQTAGCVVGSDYPKRIVDHDEVRERNLAWMGAAYKKGGTGGNKTSPSKAKSTPVKKEKEAKPSSTQAKLAFPCAREEKTSSSQTKAKKEDQKSKKEESMATRDGESKSRELKYDKKSRSGSASSEHKSSSKDRHRSKSSEKKSTSSSKDSRHRSSSNSTKQSKSGHDKTSVSTKEERAKEKPEGSGSDRSHKRAADISPVSSTKKKHRPADE